MSEVLNEAIRARANFAATVGSRESDAPLVDAARRCEPEAFKELMTKYGPRVFRIAIRITRNHEDAEEVSQDSFRLAFLHMDTFRGESRLYTWLVRIAINQSLTKLRTHRLREMYFDRPATTEDGPWNAEVADTTPTPEQRYSQEERRQILGSAMSELPPRFREVLRLREIEEHSTEETARMLGLSISAVKSRAARGRQKLRAALTKQC